ncbi:hypothetical protein F2P81_018399 [Scophthalmus maximus]|uniref:Uncharacterized protein n=1 Tax=Scophthalmus maximus TaxID=52904 RepID=A0A6A4SEI0_SCOMX|nr:hypothetical protein F2P81_018399 [Scophthalmus maximus]
MMRRAVRTALGREITIDDRRRHKEVNLQPEAVHFCLPKLLMALPLLRLHCKVASFLWSDGDDSTRRALLVFPSIRIIRYITPAGIDGRWVESVEARFDRAVIDSLIAFNYKNLNENIIATACEFHRWFSGRLDVFALPLTQQNCPSSVAGCLHLEMAAICSVTIEDVLLFTNAARGIWMPPIVEHNDVFSWREIGGRATFRKINQGELDCELLQRQREEIAGFGQTEQSEKMAFGVKTSPVRIDC